MTIEHRGVVDFIGVSKKDGHLYLTISDHLDWHDYEYHAVSIQNKINDYLEYIYSNRFHEIYSASDRSRIKIQLIMKHQPTAEGDMLLKKIYAEIDNLGFEFIYYVFVDEQNPDNTL